MRRERTPGFVGLAIGQLQLRAVELRRAIESKTARGICEAGEVQYRRKDLNTADAGRARDSREDDANVAEAVGLGHELLLQRTELSAGLSENVKLVQHRAA